jgi:hypothetical protein
MAHWQLVVSMAIGATVVLVVLGVGWVTGGSTVVGRGSTGAAAIGCVGLVWTGALVGRPVDDVATAVGCQTPEAMTVGCSALARASPTVRAAAAAPQTKTTGLTAATTLTVNAAKRGRRPGGTRPLFAVRTGRTSVRDPCPTVRADRV